MERSGRWVGAVVVAIVCLAGVCGQQKAALAATYYVSAVGDNDNEGTSPNQPWQTIAQVSHDDIQRKLKAGDRVLFRAGDTFAGELRISASGAVGQPLVFGRYPQGTAGDDPQIRGSVRITGSQVTLEHLDIRAFAACGVRIQDTDSVTVRHCRIHDPSYSQSTSGVIVDRSTAVTLATNRVHSGLDYGLQIDSSDRVRVAANTVYDCRQALLRVRDAANMEIEENLCFTSNGGASRGERGLAILIRLSNDSPAYTPAGANLLVRSNAIANCRGALRLVRERGAPNSFEGLQILNNTLVSSDVHFNVINRAADGGFGTARVANTISYFPSNCTDVDQRHFGGNAFTADTLKYRSNLYWPTAPPPRDDTADELTADPGPGLVGGVDWCHLQVDEITQWFFPKSIPAPAINIRVID
ncbi:MAG: right-handed parallel beta-helix repeat-containing protein [Desulfosarcinaceae bacterium]|nr:right-handed parallel beta-helix repeat-containing protein [Desulfosarcinaceae bacterium]